MFGLEQQKSWKCLGFRVLMTSCINIWLDVHPLAQTLFLFFFFTVEGKNRPDWNEQLIVNLHLPVEAIFYFLFFLWSKRHPCTDLQASKPGLTIRFRFAAVVSSKVRAWILRSPDCISAVIVTSTCCRWQQVRRHQIKVLMLWRSCSSLPLKELQIYVAYMSHYLHPWQSNKTSVSVLR